MGFGESENLVPSLGGRYAPSPGFKQYTGAKSGTVSLNLGYEDGMPGVVVVRVPCGDDMLRVVGVQFSGRDVSRFSYCITADDHMNEVCENN